MVTELEILRKLKHKLVVVKMKGTILFHSRKSLEYEITGTSEA